MIVAGVTQSTAYHLAIATLPAPDSPVPPDPVVLPDPETPPPASAVEDEQSQALETVGTDDSEEGGGRAKGVLRLLQAGHFKGVADVRLRINFHDEIAAAQAEAAKSAANEAVTELSGTVNARLEGLASSGELSEEQLAALGQLRDSFNESVAAAAEAFLAAKQPTGEALTGSLDEAFDSLAGSLGAMLAANAVAQPEDAEPVSGAEAGPDLEAMLQALREAYAAAMVALNDALASKSFLPELSPDPGHGVAFAKFLAMYEQLQGPQEGEQADSQEPVDVQA